MATTTTDVTAKEVMDRSAVLMNDPTKTDYTYVVLIPFLKMALDEMFQSLMDSQVSPTLLSPGLITVPKGEGFIRSPSAVTGPLYPADLVEIQGLSERLAGTNDPFTPMIRTEFIKEALPAEKFTYWAWEDQMIRVIAATTDRELLLRYIGNRGIYDITPDTVIGTGTINSMTFLAYKTAAYAAQFVGENVERAAILDAKAEQALEKMESISNKGRQQIMTRHRPFRAAYKARGGW